MSLLRTSPHKKDKPRTNPSKTIGFNTPAQDESVLMPLTAKILQLIYKSGYPFYQGGVMLGGLTKAEFRSDRYTTLPRKISALEW